MQLQQLIKNYCFRCYHEKQISDLTDRIRPGNPTNPDRFFITEFPKYNI